MALGGFYADGPAQTADDAVNHGQPHTRAFTFGLGGEKWIKNTIEVLGGDPNAGIGYGELEIGTWLQAGMLVGEISFQHGLGEDNRQATASIGHGISGVGG